LAKALHLRGGARAAGHALAARATGKGIPWHRVVGAGGRILIREPLASLQRRLLESEGIQAAGQGVDLARYGWKRPRPRT
jgi:methylated-DNA-protein-cysteine methyltransferase-like protein